MTDKIYQRYPYARLNLNQQQIYEGPSKLKEKKIERMR